MDCTRGRLAQEASLDGRVAGSAFSTLGRAIGESALQALRHCITQELGDADRAVFDTPKDFEKVIIGITGEAAPLVMSIINAGIEREFGLPHDPAGQGRLSEVIEEILRRYG